MDFPIKNVDFPWQNVSSPEGTFADSQDQLLRFRVFSHGFTDRVTGPSLLSSGQVFVRDLMPGHVEVPMTDAERRAGQGWLAGIVNWLGV